MPTGCWVLNPYSYILGGFIWHRMINLTRFMSCIINLCTKSPIVLQNFEDTEDVLQEAFIRIDKNISKVSDPSSPKTKNFVVIITKRLALNMLRKKKGIQVEELLATLEDVRIEASPERANETKTVQELVKMAIRDLPERYRDCLFLALIDEYTPKEIAYILEMKEQSIYKRLKRGKKMLQDRLADMGVTYED